MPLGETRRAERRARILQHARDLLTSIGYEAVTMDRLAEACGVTKPTLYNTFGGKDDLLTEAVQDAYGRILARARAPGAARGLDRLVNILTITARVTQGERERGPKLLKAVRPSVSGPFGETVQQTISEAMGEAVDEMLEDGELRPWIDPVLFTQRLTGLQRSVYTDYSAGKIPIDRLDGTVLYAVCLLLVGATQGDAAKRCRRLAREYQERLAARVDAAAPDAGDAAAGAG